MVNRRLPPLRSLEAFMHTVRLGSARAAANQLGLSPSALSRRIATLEEFIGKKLFTRARQAMQLTDEGAAFHEAVLPHFEALARAVEGQSESTSLLRLHLGVLPLFGTQRLFPRLAELRRLHPILHIDIDTGPHLEDRVGDTLDAAIILSNRPSAGLHAVRLDENKVHAITNAELAATLGDTPDAGLLARQTFLIHNGLPESFTAWKAALDLSDLEPAAIDHYDSGQLMLAAAAQGLGIAIMHDDHRRRAADNRLVNLYDAEVESPYSYWFVCKPGALEERPVRMFHDWLVKAGL
ncbi:LysR substrate-binding domain-containing protein [Citromicrobium bathyomarinum]|uniref:LysR substrate-binding domain-containing protein n=1 Tax=Citromicrobium bathyomarinum TaxID=72174 RepID=UPI001E4AE8C4|nr:LysR substrate-binding domain-containing protein [Citromicrobium bathyomarinum]MCD1622000.1 LysR family transcriptional regulator [Citromicrobium bathyomarinum]